jgi:hypothetical protein
MASLPSLGISPIDSPNHKEPTALPKGRDFGIRPLSSVSWGGAKAAAKDTTQMHTLDSPFSS